jgi:hypothetical protein
MHRVFSWRRWGVRHAYGFARIRRVLAPQSPVHLAQRTNVGILHYRLIATKAIEHYERAQTLGRTAVIHARGDCTNLSHAMMEMTAMARRSSCLRAQPRDERSANALGGADMIPHGYLQFLRGDYNRPSPPLPRREELTSLAARNLLPGAITKSPR